MLVTILAALVGLSLGLLGAGGSILAVPILNYAAGLSAKEAVAGSLFAVGAVSAIGTLLAHREGRVLWKQGSLFAVVATLGTLGGVQIAARISGTVQMFLFILVMLVAIFAMIKKANTAPSEEPFKPSSGAVGSVLKALGVGLTTGLVGVGGGFLMVPALVALFDMPMKKATGTSLWVIAVNSAVGLAGYSQMIDLNWWVLGTFTGAAILGLFGGMLLARRLDGPRLTKIFIGVVVLVCLYTIGQEVSPLL